MQPPNPDSAAASPVQPPRANPSLPSSPGSSPPSHPAPAPYVIQRHWLLRASFIVVAVAFASALRYWLGQSGLRETYLTYEPTVIVTACLLGGMEGIWTTLLSALAADYFFLAGRGLIVAHHEDRVSMAIFFLAGIVLSPICGALRTRTLQKQLALELLRSSEERFFAERRRLHEVNFKFAAIVQSSEDAIIGKDTHGTVIAWNRGAQNVFGYTAAEMIGESIRKLLPAGREQEEEDTTARILRGEIVDHFDTVRVAKGDRKVNISLTISPIKDANGIGIGASMIARDITETRNLQKQLQQSQKMEAVGQLTGGIAHDFNNLLAIVLGALELQEPAIAGNTEAIERWQIAYKAATRGADLTRRLLAFSSLGKFKVAPTSLQQSIRNTMDMAARLLGPEIATKLTLDESMPPVLVDPASLESALLNLIVNARDAMPKGGNLTVSAGTCELEDSTAATLNGTLVSGTYACISVTDSGTGMAPELVDRVFEPFFTTKERGRGTGLGLSMVYGFVKQSNGGIRIYSEPGYGTTITFYLPFAGEHTAVAPASRAEDDSRQRSGVVLIVDDEADLVEIAVTYLTGRGYTVLTAHDAKEALRVIEQHGAVDTMVTDIVMGGGMDGMELAQAVRLRSPSTRIVYSSGFPADALSERSLPLAGSLVLQKPYRLAELGASVDHAIASA